MTRLANPPFNDFDTALRASAFLQTGGTLQVMTERHDNFRQDDDVRWQPSGANRSKAEIASQTVLLTIRGKSTAKGSPQGERGGVHQFGVPPKTARRDSANRFTEGKPQVVSEAKDNNANSAWVQHFIHHLAPAEPGSSGGMAGFVLANGSLSSGLVKIA